MITLFSTYLIYLCFKSVITQSRHQYQIQNLSVFDQNNFSNLLQFTPVVEYRSYNSVPRAERKLFLEYAPMSDMSRILF